MKTSLKKISLTFSVALLHTLLLGQMMKSDSLVLSSSRQSLTNLYDQNLGGNTHLYNGIEFIDPFQKKVLEGFPYFLMDDWQDGSIFYDGQLYENIPFLFDIFKDRIIVDHPRSHARIELIPQKIKYFTIADKHFVQLKSPTAGFYQELYRGETIIYARHYKTIQEKIGSKSMITEFLTRRKLYIVREGTYHVITSKKSALKVLKEHKSELNKLLGQEKISFKNNKEYALARMGQYFDQLNTKR
ncbi:MAG: hypothetical protein JNM78_04655 [Cyclobacteriaceae bacterium]|nr:hypothetical protein [Cyclobacteriaceae bacterium]